MMISAPDILSNQKAVSVALQLLMGRIAGQCRPGPAVAHFIRESPSAVVTSPTTNKGSCCCPAVEPLQAVHDGDCCCVMGVYIIMMVVMMAQVTAVDLKEEKETEAVTLGAAQ